MAGIVDVERDGADARTVGDVVRMRKAVGFAVDDEFDLALRPPLDRLAAMQPGLAEAELAEQFGEIAGLVLVDGEFHKADAAALRLRFERGRQSLRRLLRHFDRKLILQQDQRAQPVGGGARRRAGTKLVVEDFERERPVIAGGDHGFHESGHRQVALPRETAEMPAPGQHVEAELRRVGQLHQEYLVRRDR